MAKPDKFTRQWIIKHSLIEIPEYEKGILTLRALHYRMVFHGMTNTIPHYKRVVEAMIQARWKGIVSFDTFSDHERAMIGETDFETVSLDDEIQSTKETMKYWMKNYFRNRWENQPIYPEVFIEKKALQGVFQKPCDAMDVALGACKGYPSLTFLKDTAERLKFAIHQGKKAVILYFGDYDPSGEDIPRSIYENLKRMGVPSVEVRRILLMEHQVVKWKLPHAPIKPKDTRSDKWEGLGQVELDAVGPKELMRLCAEAIDSVFDYELYDELMETEAEEKDEYITEIKRFVIEDLLTDKNT